ncbi:fimbrillin family protein [Sphingobacterium humi]|uniref:Fimbrillin family protein n=1 Tax=Sphingobacterium humi TaxID=1796905 RepID=A0A6N8L2Z0_9SPHI|nr:fimbrillin family protein [Sphingobacterium humi]MVZ63657.1 hypothetical protein [Sphingobacterium humi]
MKLSNFKTINLKSTASLMLAIALLSSCNKEVIESSGLTKVQINVGVGKGESQTFKAATLRSGLSSNVVRSIEIPFNSDITLVATFKSVGAQATSSPGLKASTKTLSNISAVNGTNTFPLDAGTSYTVLAYQDGVLKSTQNFTVGATPNVFELAPGEYTFITYAAGNNAILPAPTGQLSLAKFENLAASVDLMYAKTQQTISQGVTNTLNAVLKHVFSQITVKFNTAVIGNATIGNGGEFAPSFPTANVTLTDGAVTETGIAGVSSITFPTGTTSGNLFESTPIKVIANTTQGQIKLKAVTIGGVTKDVTLNNLTILPNYRYELTIDLKRPSSVNIGNIHWSLGNLIYNNGEYGFAANNAAGSFFFQGYVLPKNMDQSVPYAQQNSEANKPLGINGAAGDPCELVAPAGSWRMPYTDEVNTLIAATNEGVPSYIRNRFKAYYETASGTTLGVFFNIHERPSESTKANYLFLPMLGYYQNDFTNNRINTEGYYIVKDRGAATYQFLRIGGPQGADYDTRITAADKQTAAQIICVKD